MERERWLSAAPTRAALRVAFIFLLPSLVWIVFSDKAAARLFGDVASLSAFQTGKGLAYVLVLGLILFIAVRAQVTALATRTQEMLRATEAAAVALRQAQRESQALERAKSLFLSSVSHELRTPLNAIIGFAEMLGDKGLNHSPDRVHDYAAEISGAGYHLLELVQGIVACAEAEAGQPLEVESLDIQAEAARAIRHVNAPVELSATPGTVHADPIALQQILFALLNNAVAHTPKGTRIRINCRSAAGGGAVMSVEDDGPGLPEGVRNGIGRPFLRGSDPLTAGVGGLGLGLYLATLLMRRHGGSMAATTGSDGRGTRIELSFPG